MSTYTNRNFGELGELGLVVQLVVAAVQGTTLAASAYKRSEDIKKFLKSTGKTQEMSHAAQLELKQKEMATARLLQTAKHKTGLYEDIQMKKMVVLVGGTLVVVTIVGIVLYYMLAVPSDEGDYEYVYE